MPHDVRPMLRLPALVLAASLWGLVAGVSAQDGPWPVHEAAGHMTVPKGFSVTLFAGEPDVVQPIAMAFDERGRLWVVECLSYPNWRKDGKGNDRVVILEDRDGDGRHESRKVFFDRGVNLSGIELGFGGVWLCSAPNLVFIPDRNGDDVPDADPQVLLDGWDMIKTKHNVFNSLGWGPDGWLYGCNGIQAESLVGAPGTPDAQRVAINCGVWRYHPTGKQFEVVASGTTNPWGLDWDNYGEAFITNCVIKHIFHVIPGAHYDRMYGQDLNPHVYDLLPSCADHIHWAGGSWTSSRGGKGEHDSPGGGHAHVGCCVYLGANFPAEYRNSVLMCNLHGNRLNRDTLARQGSTYVAKHAPDFLLANDEWFRGLVVKYGPDGGLYVSDWTDTGECHNYKEVDRRNGRIYKVVYGQPKYEPVDWQKASPGHLLKLAVDSNEWNSRRARLTLQERAAELKPDSLFLDRVLEPLVRQNGFTQTLNLEQQLRVLWVMHLTNHQADYSQFLDNAQPLVRAWSVRLMVDRGTPGADMIKKLVELAGSETHPKVRLALASALQKVPLAERWPLAAAMVANAADAADSCLPLMIWYGVEPLTVVDVARTAELIGRSRIPLVRQNLVRRLVERDDKALTEVLPPLVGWLARQSDPEVVRDVLEGMVHAWRGRHNVPRSENWSRLSAAQFVRDPQIDWLRLQLSARLGENDARHRLLETLLAREAPEERRLQALTELAEMRFGPLGPKLAQLLTDPVMRGPAIRAFSAFDDPATPSRLLMVYADLNAEERADVVATLASRAGYAELLLNAVSSGRIAKGDIPLTVVRQVKAFKKPVLDAAIEKIWGALRSPSKDKQQEKARWREQLSSAALAKADLPHGRELFAKSCANCHVLFEAGKRIGPELTGSQRTNLDYVLDNVLDPSAAVARDYQMTQIVLVDGRLLTGIVVEENEQTLTLQSPSERITFAKADIDDRERSPLSMMPEGLLNSLSAEDARDLVGYLASPRQVPLPKSASIGQ